MTSITPQHALESGSDTDKLVIAILPVKKVAEKENFKLILQGLVFAWRWGLGNWI